MLSYLYSRVTKQWQLGPPLDEETLRDTEKAARFAAGVVAFAQKAQATSIGVVLHIADEFSTAELKPDYDNPADLNDLRQAAEKNPAEILHDSSISPDQNSWRILPYPDPSSESIATTIFVSRQYAQFMEQLRLAGEAMNFPVIAQALSSPLVSLLAIPRTVRPTEGRPFVTVFHYTNFTVVSFFNAQGDLRLIRTLPHRGQGRPSNLQHAVSTTTAALEFIDPDVFLYNFSSQSEAGLFPDLRVVFPSSRVEFIPLAQTSLHQPPVPIHAPELLISTSIQEVPDDAFTSHTFSVFGSERWVIQNFLPTPPEVAEIYPSHQDLKLLRALRWIRSGAAACMLLALGWVLYQAVNIMTKPEWNYDPQAARNVQARLAGLNAEKIRMEHWDNLLEDRSRAWTSMELLTHLFPENEGFLIKSYNYTARPELVAGHPKAGFVKEWKISGFARDDANPRLNLINSQGGISSIFAEMAERTHNPAFRTDLGSRSLVSNVQISENSAFRPRPAEEIRDDDTSTYARSFSLVITQRFEASDPMAITVAKAP